MAIKKVIPNTFLKKLKVTFKGFTTQKQNIQNPTL